MAEEPANPSSTPGSADLELSRPRLNPAALLFVLSCLRGPTAVLKYIDEEEDAERLALYSAAGPLFDRDPAAFFAVVRALGHTGQTKFKVPSRAMRVLTEVVHEFGERSSAAERAAPLSEGGPKARITPEQGGTNGRDGNQAA